MVTPIKLSISDNIMSLLYYLPLALAAVLLIHTSDALSILPPTSVATLMNGATNTFATIGAAQQVYLVVYPLANCY